MPLSHLIRPSEIPCTSSNFQNLVFGWSRSRYYWVPRTGTTDAWEVAGSNLRFPERPVLPGVRRRAIYGCGSGKNSSSPNRIPTHSLSSVASPPSSGEPPPPVSLPCRPRPDLLRGSCSLSSPLRWPPVFSPLMLLFGLY